jgi:2-polyprenyl-3-methyl-5-hydroxy-6-metoxy-1,4-benzoquinol methylase
MNTCWCGSERSAEFSPEYRLCLECNTLIYKEDLSPQDFSVEDDETDFYGKNYWMKHQQENYGYSDFETRTRLDLTERNLFWLKSLLSLSLPPGKALELGCAHGSFVALLNQAGYQAQGLEMSPWVVEFGRSAFGIEVLQGPLEEHAIPEGSLDAIVLMDVIEHLPDPQGTMGLCLRLLKPEGVLLIQTPEYKPGMVYETLVEESGAFLEQLKPREHLYLFSRDSIRQFFSRLGANHLQFLPAIYEKYDMFLAVSRAPLRHHEANEVDNALKVSGRSRIVAALLDMAKIRDDLLQKLDESEADRAARLLALEISEADRAARLLALEESEADRLARFEQIQALTQMVKDGEMARETMAKELSDIKQEVRQLLSRRLVRRIARTLGLEEVEHLLARLD